jgi:hypothetical protein
VLRATGKDGQVALEDIRTLAAKIGRLAVSGANWTAARCFVDYWNRAGTFEALKPDAQADLVRYVAKACLDFRASIEERTPLVAYRRLRVPLRLMIGQRAPVATVLLARSLAVVMNPGALRVVAGAGHMGPTSHSDNVLVLVLLGYAAWTLRTLFGTIGIYRWSRILPAAPQLPTGVPTYRSSDWYQRAMRAHMNCIENLPIYAAIVLALMATGLQSSLIDRLAVHHSGCVHRPDVDPHRAAVNQCGDHLALCRQRA